MDRVGFAMLPTAGSTVPKENVRKILMDDPWRWPIGGRLSRGRRMIRRQPRWRRSHRPSVRSSAAAGGQSGRARHRAPVTSAGAWCPATVFRGTILCGITVAFAGSYRDSELSRTSRPGHWIVRWRRRSASRSAEARVSVGGPAVRLPGAGWPRAQARHKCDNVQFGAAGRAVPVGSRVGWRGLGRARGNVESASVGRMPPAVSPRRVHESP